MSRNWDAEPMEVLIDACEEEGLDSSGKRVDLLARLEASEPKPKTRRRSEPEPEAEPATEPTAEPETEPETEPTDE